MSNNTALGDRMKRYETPTRMTMPPRTYSIVRVDGRCFHTYLRKAKRPFDEVFAADMDAVAEALCQEISGAKFAYTQSDEISVVFTDFDKLQSEPWFGGIAAKQISSAASLATAVMNERRPGGRALFDARVFTLPDPVEVANYLIWRQRDAVRNSISMAAQAHFSHGLLRGVSSEGMQELLWSAVKVNWNDYPAGFKRGRVSVRKSGAREVAYTAKRTGNTKTAVATRSWWESEAAPHFVASPDNWLAGAIPALPSLTKFIGTTEGTPAAPVRRTATSDRRGTTTTEPPRIFTATSGSGGDYTPSSCEPFSASSSSCDSGGGGGGCE